jgi:hypothetical protein
LQGSKHSYIDVLLLTHLSNSETRIIKVIEYKYSDSVQLNFCSIGVVGFLSESLLLTHFKGTTLNKNKSLKHELLRYRETRILMYHGYI